MKGSEFCLKVNFSDSFSIVKGLFFLPILAGNLFASAQSIAVPSMTPISVAVNPKLSTVEERASILSQKIIEALNEVEVTGDFKSAIQRRKVDDGLNLTPILKKIEKRRLAHDFLKAKGKSYKSLSSQFTIDSAVTSNGVVSVTIQEFTEVELGDPGEIADGIKPKYIKRHLFTFSLAGNSGNFRLESHKVLNDPEDPSPESIKQAVPVPAGATPSIIDFSASASSAKTPDIAFDLRDYTYSHQGKFRIAIESHSDQSKKSLSKYSERQSKWGVTSRFPSILIAQRTVVFDRIGTRQYAEKWWNGFNPKYRNFEKVYGFVNSGDCTNYASQILYEGGKWVMTGDLFQNTNDNVWWYNFKPLIPVTSFGDTQTYTWAAATNFWSFLNSRPNRAQPVNKSSLLTMGDIVQVDFGLGEGLSHTMVVTYRRPSDGMIYLTAHTNPHFEMPIYDIRAKYPNSKFYTWKLTDRYDY
jgi:hypothetical protein